MNGAHPVGYWRACTIRLGRVILVSAFVAPCLAAAGGLEDAVSLYREARYAEALDVLNGLGTGAEAQTAGAADPQRVAEYRALCLIALDRDSEARSVMEKLLEGQPDYRPTAGEFPPRFVAAVKAVRTEMLPALVRAEYRRGKTSYDQKEYSQAEAHLRRVLTLLKDSDLTPSGRESVADLRDLADGFLALIPARPGPVPSLPPPVEAATKEATEEAAPPPAAAFFTTADAGVVPPVAVHQELPPWRPSTDDPFMRKSGGSTGVLELIIDERGQVASARLTIPISPLYDDRLLAAARRWQYRPASRDGKPVRFRKLIEVRIDAAKEPLPSQ